MMVVEDADGIPALAEGRVGLVPTMGFLHEGHLSLIETARAETDLVVVSVFVNPSQFDRMSDLAAYPRDLDRDVDLLESADVDVVFAPTVETMYPTGYPDGDGLSIDVGGPAVAMEGSSRQGHFTGVATIVAKLFARILPDVAYFGRKDAQQVVVVEALVRELGLPIEIRGCPVVREPDGLALSSRNVRLDPHARIAARKLSGSMLEAADRYDAGVRDHAELVDPILGLDTDPAIDLDYVALASAETAAVTTDVGGRQFLAAACAVGGVRLLDAVWFEDEVADRGIRLDHASILYGGS